jgi:RimJ/RimL family protein N-acetyltransferase
VEIGFRFFSDCQCKGYALESATALRDYCVELLGADTAKCRCFKQNLPSKKLIERLGLIKSNESQTHYFFAKTIKEQTLIKELDNIV